MVEIPKEIFQVITIGGLSYLIYLVYKCPCEKLFACTNSKTKFFGIMAGISLEVLLASLKV